MTTVKLDHFSGLLPRVPVSLLPAMNASEAQHCDFAYGELRSSKDHAFIKNLANSAQSIYTDNGLVFYSWLEDVNAVRSPLANDTFDRLYYTTPDDFRVTSRSGMSLNGGQPATSYRVGVPRPLLAPVLSVSTVSPLLAATLTATFHYEAAGVKYQEQVIPLTTVVALTTWTFTPPEKHYTEPVRDPDTRTMPRPIPSETPALAVPVLRLTAKNSAQEVVLDLYTANSALNGDSAWTLTSSKTGNANDYTVTFAASNREADKETKAYIYTYVNIYGEEGPASPPASITSTVLLAVMVQVGRDAQTADYAPIKEIRIYRTPSGSEIADYFYVAAIPVLSQGEPAFSFNDTVKAAGLNEPLASEMYYPPHPALVGLTTLPNGILMAWKGNELHFSDAYKPWSWPPAYVKTLGDFAIVGAMVAGSGALVTTTGKPFRLAGISPDSMTESNLLVQQAGVSKWAMADVGGMLVYASHDGIVAFDGGQPTLAFSDRFFTREVWRARYAQGLVSMRFAVWDGRLIVYSHTAAFTPFLISLDEAKGAMTDLPDFTASCSFISPLSDQCYFSRGGALFQFAGGADAVALWASREIQFNSPVNFGVAQVACTGLWRVEFWADEVLRHTESNLNGRMTFRLPSGFRAERWVIRIAGKGVFRECRMAATGRELAQV